MESSSLAAAAIHFARLGGLACSAWRTIALAIKRKIGEPSAFMLWRHPVEASLLHASSDSRCLAHMLRLPGSIDILGVADVLFVQGPATSTRGNRDLPVGPISDRASRFEDRLLWITRIRAAKRVAAREALP